MKILKIISFSLLICGLFSIIQLKKENKNKNKLYRNNLSNELESIEDIILNSDNLDINNLLNEHGFLKTKFDTLNENDKLNYSLIHGNL
jgi:hypothetical protein